MNFYETDMMTWRGFDTSHVVFDYCGDSKTWCPSCREEGGDRSGDNLHVYADKGGAHCFKCGFTVPSLETFQEAEGLIGGSKSMNKSSVISDRDKLKLEEKRLTFEGYEEISNSTSDKLTVGYRGLSPQICARFGVRWEISGGNVTKMYVPSTVNEDGKDIITGYKVRIVDPKGFYSKGYVGKCNHFFGQTSAVEEVILIVGGEIDMLSAQTMFDHKDFSKYGRKVTVVSSLVGEDSTVDVIRANYNWVTKHKKIILALDNDDAGKAAMDKCLQILPPDRTCVANLRYKDINEYQQYQDAANFLQDCYWRAEPLQDDGIISSDQLFAYGLEAAKDEGVKLPFHMMDLEATVPKLLFDNIMLVVGSTSSGKTSNVDSINDSLIINSGYKTGVVSMEASRKRYALKVASRIVGQPLNRLSSEEQVALQMEYKNQIMSYYTDSDGEPRFAFADADFETLKEAETCIMNLITVHRCKIIFIDPLQSIIGNKSNEEQRTFMNFLEKLKKKYDVLFILGTHTRKATSDEKSGSDGAVQKEDSIEGSGSISKAASLIIILSRNKNSDCWIERNTTYYSVPKNRDFEITGELLAKSFYRSSCSRLYPYSYAEKMNFFRGDFDGDFMDDGLGLFITIDEFNSIQSVEEAKAAVKSQEIDDQIESNTGDW